MASISIIKNKCIGCGLCQKACPYGAICIEKDSMGKKYGVITDACTLCGACVKECHVQAIQLCEGERAVQKDASSYQGILVFCEQSKGKLRSVGLELISKAQKLAGELKTSISAVVMGENPDVFAPVLFAYGADRVLGVAEKRLDTLNDLDYVEALYQIIKTYKPAIVLIGATAFGRSVAPRVAAKLNTGLTADCTKLEVDIEEKLLLQTRPAFGGNLMATIVCKDSRPQMATVRPKVFAAEEPDNSRTGEMIHAQVHLPSIRLLEVERLLETETSDAFNIGEADILISVGKGIGNEKNIALARELAKLLGGTVSCSRPLVDSAWCEYSLQVGQTGKTVSPKIYMAFGISGAVQHMAGVAADTVVAVNTDPDAPIFNFADHAIIGDCVEVLHALIERCRIRDIQPESRREDASITGEAK